MEQNASKEPGGEHTATAESTSPEAPSLPHRVGMALSAQAGGGECPTCGGVVEASPLGTGIVNFVYALGRVQPRFSRLAVEKEFAQATGRAETAGLTDRQAFQAVLSQRQNRYLVRQLCWVLTIEGLETYLLQPRDPADCELLVEAIRPTPHPTEEQHNLSCH